MDELTEERKVSLEKERVKSAKILECLDSLEKSEEWNTLKELIFNDLVAKIERLLISESLKPEINTNKIYVLQGELNVAKRFCDVKRFAEFHKSLLEEVNRQLK